MKSYMYFWNLYLQQEVTKFSGKAVLTLANSEQAFKVREQILPQKYSDNFGLNTLKFFNKIFKSDKISEKIENTNLMFATMIPEPFEIVWQNFGLRSKEKA